MKFDWINFLNRYGVQYVTKSKNTKEGNLSIKCPFCGFADPSFHMGINPNNSAFGCLRDDDHRSKYPHRLIMKIAGLSWEQACELIGEEYIPEDFDLKNKRDRLNKKGIEQREKMQWDESFRKLSNKGKRNAFVEYLISRGFAPEDIPTMCKLYKLRCATKGTWYNRLIFPVIHEKELIGWTGRDIGDSELRYRAHPPGKLIKQFLFNQNAVKDGGRVLVIDEGPLDAYKIDFYGKDFSIRAIATMGTALTEEQVSEIIQLSKRFDHTAILLDRDALSKALKLRQRLAMIHPVRIPLLEGFDDPGSIPYGRIQEQIDIIRQKTS